MPEDDADAWYEFIDYFGTHYIRQAQWGAKQVMTSVLTSESVEHLESKGVSIGVEASASFDVFSGSVKVETEEEKEKRELFEKECKQQEVHTFGMKIPADPEKWA